MEHVVDEKSANRASGGSHRLVENGKNEATFAGCPTIHSPGKKCLQCIVVNGEKQIGL